MHAKCIGKGYICSHISVSAIFYELWRTRGSQKGILNGVHTSRERGFFYEQSCELQCFLVRDCAEIQSILVSNRCLKRLCMNRAGKRRIKLCSWNVKESTWVFKIGSKIPREKQSKLISSNVYINFVLHTSYFYHKLVDLEELVCENWCSENALNKIWDALDPTEPYKGWVLGRGGRGRRRHEKKVLSPRFGARAEKFRK